MAKAPRAYLASNDIAYTEELLAFAKRPISLANPERSAWWLKSDFWAPKWSCEFGEGIKLTISWDIRLSDGTSLLAKNSLSEAMRSWLLIQSSHRVTRGFREKPGSISGKIGAALRLLDYFLLHHSHHELLNFGFSATSTGEFTAILVRLGSFGSVESSIYGWAERASTFLNNLISEFVDESDVEKFRKSGHRIAVVDTPTEDRLLVGFDDSRIVAARIAMMRAGFYKRPRKVGDESLYEPNNSAITTAIYSNTFNGLARKSKIPELFFGELQPYDRELQSAYTRYGDENEIITEMTLKSYSRRLQTLIHLTPFEFRPAKESLSGLSLEHVSKALSLSPKGRFRSVPTTHLMQAMSKAITYYLENENHLFETYLSLARAAYAEGISMAEYFVKRDANKLIHPNTLLLGIKVFSLKRPDGEAGGELTRRLLHKGTYFDLLRKSHGLLEALRVLYGAIGLTLALLGARRRSEVCRLPADDFLDETETNLNFLGAKTGQGPHRERMARPIPPIVVRMLKRVSKFQDDMFKAGLISQQGALFALPEYGGKLTVDGESIELAIDSFMDFIEMPCDADGFRYYVRFHQGRRFLPQLFMDSGTNTNIGVLQWLLGHTDPGQIWNYLLTVCAGDAINQAAAQTATAQLRAGNEAFEDLSKLLHERYGVGDFWAMTEEELADYILQLEEAGEVRVEMEFFDEPDGRHHRMLMKVIKRGKNGNANT